MGKSNFKNDVEQENILTDIFHKIFFENYLDKKCNYSSELISFNQNSEMQYQGIDIIVKNSEGKTSNIDVKCQTNKYINSPTNTFCIEVDYLKNGTVKDGWFIDKKNKTDYFLFVWIHKAEFSNMIYTVDELKDVEFMLVNKNDIKNYLVEAGVDNQKMKLISTNMRNNDISRQKVGNISFVRTSYLNEQPVNIVINKNIYKTMPLTKSYRYLNGHIKMI